jgi:methyl-accepting chemotaxis protein
VSSASLEQSRGIGEINQAIAQLESTTQQNAALVEEASAASQSLDEQVQRLEHLVARFSL